MMGDNEYQDIMDYGRKVFGFHPDAEFDSLTEMMRVASRADSSMGIYHVAATRLAEYMASRLDLQIADERRAAQVLAHG